ncbi:hypothetical protein Bpfe_003463, partial [Biomphalaria pfeifferi]
YINYPSHHQFTLSSVETSPQKFQFPETPALGGPSAPIFYPLGRVGVSRAICSVDDHWPGAVSEVVSRAGWRLTATVMTSDTVYLGLCGGFRKSENEG